MQKSILLVPNIYKSSIESGRNFFYHTQIYLAYYETGRALLVMKFGKA
jgi:hypothetical protein